jgi:signal transduction histidine kinase/ligand-binding sensor domain-containing protein
MWFATGDGLVRFDGVHFRVFNSTNTPSLKVNGFSPALLEARDGALWAGTWAGGALRYFNGVFTAYTTSDGLPSNTVVRIDEDAEDAIWIFTNSGLTKWKAGRLHPVPSGPGTPFSFQTYPNQIIVNPNFVGFWRRDHTRLYRFAHGQWSRLPLPPTVRDPARFGCWTEDSQRRLWCSASGRPGEAYRIADGQLTTFRGLPRNAFVCYQDDQGFLWLSDHERHAALWKDGHLFPLSGLATPSSFRVLKDREGSFWIGTDDEGLYHLRRQLITVHGYAGRPETNYIHSVLRDSAGNIWSGASDGIGLFRKGRFAKFYALAEPAPNDLVISLWEDPDGTIWVGRYKGVSRIVGGRLRKVTGAAGKVRGPVNVIRRDRTGSLWFGSDNGLFCLRNGRLVHYSRADGLGGDNVKVLLEDRAGKLWIGTEQGLAWFVNGKFSSWTEANGWSSSEVSSMYEDAAGVLWIGTWDKGLNRLENGKLTLITTNEGLFSNSVFNIEEDNQGFLWMSCRFGIFRVRKQELNDLAAGRISFISSTHFGTADGLVNPDCTSGSGQPAGFKASDGKLWFRTQDGIGVLDPQSVRLNDKPPPVVIEDCILDGRSTPCRPRLSIAPGNQDLEIHYTALSFIRSDDIRFKYKLDGLDRDWVEAGTRRTAYYSHMPPGNYMFRVIAANSDGIWNRRGQDIAVIVLPPFYETWWFALLAFASAAALIIFAWQYRLMQLKNAHTTQLEFTRQLINSQESERKRIAAELHDSLGQHLLIIKNWAMVAQKSIPNSDPVREPLGEISAAAGQAIEEVRGIAYNLRPYQLERLGLTTAIRDLVSQLEASSSIHFFAELADVDGLFSKEGEIVVYRILQEALNNTIRHSGATQVRIIIVRTINEVELTIRDNGKGFDPQAIRFRTPGRSGFGLFGIAERVRMLQGQMDIQSAPEEGSIINISLAIEEAAHERQ